jgi:16S rRNA (guanine527-N7)-methyltransferase
MFDEAFPRPVPDILDASGFAEAANVSRETVDRLGIYADLLLKWGARINLVGKSTLPDLWRRHMLDSAQLWPHLPPDTRNLVDFGSGAGFPGLVLAIMGVPDVHLVEANSKKCAFLRESARLTEAPVTVHNNRIEEMSSWKADVVTARALAPLPVLFKYAEPFVTPNTICLFLKGRGVEEELTEIRKLWNIREDKYQSITDPEGIVLRLKVKSHDPAC